MFTINLGDGREAPSKARKKGAKRLEFLVFYVYASLLLIRIFQPDNENSQYFNFEL